MNSFIDHIFSVWKKRRLPAWVIPPISAAVLVVFFSAILSNTFQLGLRESGLLTEFLVETVIGCWLYVLLRPWWLFLTVQGIFVGTLYLSNGFKFLYFSLPVMPADFSALPVLFSQLGGWQAVLVAAPLVALLVAFVAGLRWRWQTFPLFVVGILLVWGSFWLLPGPINRGLDAVFIHHPFDNTRNFGERGPVLYLLGEEARSLAVAGPVPSQAQVTAALDDSRAPYPLPKLQQRPMRNIYIFMMETFWDPSVLTAAHYSRDPLAPAFRSLWEQSGESKAMVPVFGSGTANSEFEVLCGQPANQDAMVFVSVLKHPLRCLPRVLVGMGYHAVAFTPDDYGIWNRGNAFRLLGFQRFYDGGNLYVTDRNGSFIADSELFDEVDGLSAADGLAGPRLNYISTDSGHYPYELDAAKRPIVVRSDYNNPLVQAYANVVYYDSAELAEYIKRIRARDPQAIIVAFGDHLPVLRNGLTVFVRSGLITPSEELFNPRMLELHQSTPLLVIDGQRGPLKLGHVSLFEVPSLVMSLLGVRQPTEFNVFSPPADIHPRTYHHRLLVVSRNDDVVLCEPYSTTKVCPGAQRWETDVETLQTDILSGSDYTDAALYGLGAGLSSVSDPGIPYMIKIAGEKPCDIQVNSWTPHQTTLGHGFGGHSPMFVIKYKGQATHVEAWLGFEELDVMTRENKIVARLASKLPLYFPGEHDLTLACNGDPTRIKVGEFHVRLY